MHLLLFLDKNDKINTSEKVDELISAEIPNEDSYPHLYDVVKQFMIHGPSGEQNMGSSCMNEIRKNNLKIFQKILITRNDGKKIF